MSEWLIQLFESNMELAFILSIIINVIISILAVIPSVFITAANISVFGFWEGTLLSFAGEVIGSVVSFQLYRLGFRRLHSQDWNSKQIEKLRSINGVEAFIVILSMRLLPFVPSGIVTLGASFGKVSLLTFACATFIGKAPALLMEAYTIHSYLSWESEVKIWLTVISILLFGVYLLFKKLK